MKYDDNYGETTKNTIVKLDSLLRNYTDLSVCKDKNDLIE